MLAVFDGISSGELFSFALAFLGMLIGVVVQATLARSATHRNTKRHNDLDSETLPGLDRRLRKLELWRAEKRGAAMAGQGKDPDLTETSTRQFRRPSSED